MRSAATLQKDEARLLVVDVQERINSAMASQGHVLRIGLLLDAAAELGLSVVTPSSTRRGSGRR